MSDLTFAWHVHHEVLLEPLTEPIENRIDYIRVNKAAEEIPTRLRLLRIVKGALPKAYVEAWKAFDEAWIACGEAWKACDEAWKARDEAWKACVEAGKAYEKEILALHTEECPDCPWDGKTIFPQEEP